MAPTSLLPQTLNLIIKYCGLSIEYLGLVIIIISVIIAIIKLLSTKYNMEDVRIELAKKIIFGLEFVIAADIILTTVTIDINEIIQLGGIVLIRVLLGYSLRKEIIAN